MSGRAFSVGMLTKIMGKTQQIFPANSEIEICMKFIYKQPTMAGQDLKNHWQRKG